MSYCRVTVVGIFCTSQQYEYVRIFGNLIVTVLDVLKQVFSLLPTGKYYVYVLSIFKKKIYASISKEDINHNNFYMKNDSRRHFKFLLYLLRVTKNR